jgi:hypothetical protein
MPRNKKIALGVNLYSHNNRTDLAIESYLKIKNKFKDNIDLYNIQFKNETQEFRNHSYFSLYRCLTESSKNYIVGDSKKILPMTKECFDRMSELNYEYFIFTNDDIIVSDRYINFILNTDYDCWPASRLAISPIKKLSDIVVADNHYQVAGFDTFCIKTIWWKNNSYQFPSYVLGHPCWDVHYATLCMKLGNSTLCNKWPPPTFHQIHNSDWKDAPCPETDYNYNVFWKPYKFDSDMWHNYLFNVLLKRPGINYCQPHSNELELEKKYFNKEWFKDNYWSYQ